MSGTALSLDPDALEDLGAGDSKASEAAVSALSTTTIPTSKGPRLAKRRTYSGCEADNRAEHGSVADDPVSRASAAARGARFEHGGHGAAR
jgi:hypothetical protein